jgi:hypothetical protein
VHEHHRRLAVALRGVKLATQPDHARGTEPEIGTAGAARYDIKKDAAATGYFVDVGQTSDVKAAIEIVERSRLEIVIAGNRVPRRVQARQLVVNDVELLRRAVVGVVTRQIDEIDLSAGVAVHLVDDAAQIDMVLQTGIGEVQISDLKEAQGIFGLVEHRIDLKAIKGGTDPYGDGITSPYGSRHSA